VKGVLDRAKKYSKPILVLCALAEDKE